MGAVYTGFVSRLSWNYYHFTAYSQRNLVVTVRQTNSSQDCDGYIQSGKRPTTSDYAIVDTGTRSTFNMTIADPSQATWYIGIYGYTSCTYRISIGLSSKIQDST